MNIQTTTRCTMLSKCLNYTIIDIICQDLLSYHNFRLIFVQFVTTLTIYSYSALNNCRRPLTEAYSYMYQAINTKNYTRSKYTHMRLAKNKSNNTLS